MADEQSSISDRSYHDRLNPDLLKIIPLDAKVVLEIGCGAGRLAEAYRRINPSVCWFGVESSPEAALQAMDRGRCNWVDNTSLEECDFDDERFPEDPFDVCVIGDVLEHLADPWEQLKRLVCLATPGCQVLASIPNIGHWSIIRDLIEGHWTYADEGLLDKTHLRFFALESIKAMFADAGLHVFEIRGRTIFNEGFEEWSKKTLLRTPSAQMKAYQYIVRAIKLSGKCYAIGNIFGECIDRPVDLPKKLHVHAITAEECCARPRIREPFAALSTIPGVTCTIGPNVSIAKPPQIVIQQRARAIDFVAQKALIDLGCILVAEIDDFPGPPGGVFYEGFSPPSLRCVHAIQASTEPLAEELRKYNPNVAVFENQLAELPPLVELPKSTNDSIIIFYGAQNRGDDWKPIMPALNRVLADHPNIWMDVIHDQEFFEALETDRKKFAPFQPYGDYLEYLRVADIALLPLEPSRFNLHKSDIKFLECAANGVFVLASETIYGDLLRQEWIPGVGYLSLGQPYDCVEMFESMLRIFLKKPKMRQDRIERAYAYVRDYRMLRQHYRKRYDWYQSLLADRERLHAELLERVPELKGATP